MAGSLAARAIKAQMRRRPDISGIDAREIPGGVAGAATARAVDPFSDINFMRGARADAAWATLGTPRARALSRARARRAESIYDDLAKRNTARPPASLTLPPSSQLQPLTKPRRRGVYV